MLHEDTHSHAASSRRSSTMAEGIRDAKSLPGYRAAGTSIGYTCCPVLISRENMAWLRTAIANIRHSIASD